MRTRVGLPIGILVGTVALTALGAQTPPTHDIKPGKSTRADMRKRFGDPLQGEGTQIEMFFAPDLGLAGLSITYNKDWTVRLARLTPDRDMTLDKAVLAYGVTGDQRTSPGHLFEPREKRGTTSSYDDQGVHFYIRDRIVREVVLVQPKVETRKPSKPPTEDPSPKPKSTTPPVKPPRTDPNGGKPPSKPPPTDPTPKPRVEPVKPPTTPDPGTPKPKDPPAKPPSRINPLYAVRPAVAPLGGQPTGYEGPSFMALTVGRSKPKDAAEVLGPARYVSRVRSNRYITVHGCEKLGLDTVLVRYDARGAIEQLELRLGEPMTVQDVYRVLRLRKPAGEAAFAGATIQTFPADGIELTVAGKNVTVVRLTTTTVLRAGPSAGGIPAPE